MALNHRGNNSQNDKDTANLPVATVKEEMVKEEIESVAMAKEFEGDTFVHEGKKNNEVKSSRTLRSKGLGSYHHPLLTKSAM